MEATDESEEDQDAEEVTVLIEPSL